MRTINTICLLSLLIGEIFGQPVGEQIKSLDWELGYQHEQTNGTTKWIAATVPGAVQLDIAKAENYPVWYSAENWKNFLWMEDTHFTYRSTFDKPVLKKGERIFFYSRGIDYSFDILLNGEAIFSQEGMFTPVRLDLTNKLLDQNTISISIHPIPKSKQSPVDRVQADHSVKPAVSYGWDWHPRLVPSGIWDETGLLVEPSGHFDESLVEYTLDENLKAAEVVCKAGGRNLDGLKYTWTLVDAGGNAVIQMEGICSGQSIDCRSKLDKVQLWWPHDQ